jgi:hypothetical protein
MPTRAIVHLRSTSAVILAAGIWFGSIPEALAGGEWPDSPNKAWFEKLQRPDNHLHPHRKTDPKSLFCCGIADTVKTKFKVDAGSEKYPEDRWYAWLKDEWVLIPPEKIVNDYAPDGQPYLFVLASTIQCFVRPRGGL